MSFQLMLALVIFAVILIALISILVGRGKIPIKYSLLWYAFAAIVLLTGLFPGFFGGIGQFVGLNILSDFIIALILVILIFLNIALTVMIASQRRRINLVSQEVALLKKEVEDAKHKK